MAVDAPAAGPLVRWYSSRIGDPETGDEARGYWVYALGVVLGVVGVGLLVASDLRGPVPQWPVAIAAVALVLLVAGPLIRLPLRRSATLLVYLGALLALAAVPWFLAAYPTWRPQASAIVGLYSLGLLVMAVGGVFVPTLTAGTERDDELERQRQRIEGQHRELEDLRRELDAAGVEVEDLAGLVEQSRADQREAAADEADLVAELRGLHTSQSRFELYEDRGGEWRWRLRHRNGNLIAASGQGYTRLHDAENGVEAVRRDALGATIHLSGDEEGLPGEDEEFEPVEETESSAAFELYEDSAGRWRWRLRHDNGNVVADGGQGYSSRDGAETAIDRIGTYVASAEYLWPDPTAFEVYQDQAGEWRWRLLHRNGNILGNSGQGYSSRSNVRRAIDTIRERVDEMEFETHEDEAGEYRWRLHLDNDRTMAHGGEGYASRGSVEEAVRRVRECAPEADHLEVGQAAFEAYEDEAGEFRWRLRHHNGNVVADSGQGYADRTGAKDGIESVKRNAPNAGVEEA